MMIIVRLIPLSVRHPVRSSILIVCAAFLASCGGSDTATVAPVVVKAPATASVNMVSRAFAPASVEVSGGAVITFTNSDGFNHNVTFSNATVGTIPNYSTGAKTITMPTAVGVYPYTCTLHSGMNGSVTVK